MAVISQQLWQYKNEANYHFYLEKREYFQGRLRSLFLISSPITKIQMYVNWSQLNNAGMLNNGLMIYQSSSSSYWGKDIKSSFLTKSAVVANILDVEYIDIAQTVMEEISEELSSSKTTDSST